MYWYVLFVRGGAEEKVVDSIARNFGDKSIVPFLPQKARWFIGRGQKIIERALLFPGYVFVETDLRSGEFLALMDRYIALSSDIIRLLRSGTDQIAIPESERAAWDALLGEDKFFDSSEGLMEDEAVRVERGPLKGYEGIIKRIDRHKREAVVEIRLMGRAIRISVALHVVRKT